MLMYAGGVQCRVVKADFLKAVREAVALRLIKAVKRLLYVVNKTNVFLDAFDLGASSGIKFSLLKNQCTMDLTVDLPDSRGNLSFV